MSDKFNVKQSVLNEFVTYNDINNNSLGLLFDPENGGGMFIRNVGPLSKDYMVLHPRR
jgi:hypothetical protein